jgi:hypothetical protein
MGFMCIVPDAVMWWINTSKNHDLLELKSVNSDLPL